MKKMMIVFMAGAMVLMFSNLFAQDQKSNDEQELSACVGMLNECESAVKSETQATEMPLMTVKECLVRLAACMNKCVAEVKKCSGVIDKLPKDKNQAEVKKSKLAELEEEVEQIEKKYQEGEISSVEAAGSIADLLDELRSDTSIPAGVKKWLLEVAKKMLERNDEKVKEAVDELRIQIAGVIDELQVKIALLDQAQDLMNQALTKVNTDITGINTKNESQDKAIADLAETVDDYRLKFEVIMYGGYSSVEQGVVKLGAGILIPVSKKRLFDIEIAALAGIAADKEMGMVEFLVATPFVLKEWKDKEITALLAPEINFQAILDALGVSGGGNYAPQKNKLFSYSLNAGVGAKALFGENWFVGAKFLAGYAYAINPVTFTDKNRFNLGFSVGGGAQF